MPRAMDKSCFVGIDTSNYTTSLALVSDGGEVLANLKAPLPVKAGECGLRQSDAVFAHVKNIPQLMRAARELLASYRVAAVGVSARPRDMEGSYMPCFLAGVAAAEAFAAAAGAPLHTFSHQGGHLAAALYSAGAEHLLEAAEFGAFHVSGGTTDMLFVKPLPAEFSVEQIGGSADLHAGQAIDRIGVALGLSFPCGPALELLARENTARVPRPRISVRDGVCNLSGLENLALKLYRETGDKALCAAYTLSFLTETLTAMAEQLREKRGEVPIVFAGGVMSNRIIAKALSERLTDIYFAEPQFSADNAAGVALLCRRRCKG